MQFDRLGRTRATPRKALAFALVDLILSRVWHDVCCDILCSRANPERHCDFIDGNSWISLENGSMSLRASSNRI